MAALRVLPRAVWPGGHRREHHLSVRLYSPTEMVGMLSRAGMMMRQTWGDFEGQGYGSDSPRMIVLAEKR